MANTTYSGWGRGQYYSGPYGQPVVDSIQVTGVSAAAVVFSVFTGYVTIEGPPAVTWNGINDAQTPSWAEISTSQTPSWDDIAA